MEKGRQRETSTKEPNHRLRSSFVEPLESFETDLVVVVEDSSFSLVENQGRKTTEKDRGAIKEFNSERSCRVPLVTFGKTSW